MQKSLIAVMLALAAAIVVLLATIVYQNTLRGGAHDFKGAYQAVLLTNGQVFFGRLENLGNPYPVLQDVFYVQSLVDPQTKQTSNILVKRGKELHSPEGMILNANTIAFVEPVGEGSQVAKLIAEQKSKPR